jgi:hypothetical protein
MRMNETPKHQDMKLSYDLALALGRQVHDIQHKPLHIRVYTGSQSVPELRTWQVFDYKFPCVCLELLKWLMECHSVRPHFTGKTNPLFMGGAAYR